jgi:hypothetical protein
MPYDNYSPETEVHYTKLEVGKEYITTATRDFSGHFTRFLFKEIEDHNGITTFVRGEYTGHAFAVGKWIEVPLGPYNKFWTGETPVPEPLSDTLEPVKPLSDTLEPVKPLSDTLEPVKPLSDTSSGIDYESTKPCS